MFVCNKCGAERSSDQFYFKKNGYRRKICKPCHNGYRTSYDVVGNMLAGARSRAIKAGREFTLTREFLEKLNESQGGKCALTGWELDWNPVYSGKRVCPPKRASLDRIDSSMGYSENNVQLVCDMVNRIKSNYDQEDFYFNVQDNR